MNKAILFPGQGSQHAGMGKDLYDNFKVAREVFEEVDEALGQNLSRIIFEGGREGDNDLLTMTENTQPALMVTSIATLRVLLQELDIEIKDLCSFVAGHSLGEYTALCAAGSLSLSDTARLLRIRGNAMQSACEPRLGGMIACLGINIVNLELIITEAQKIGICQIANDNSLEQIVVSGSIEAIDYLEIVLRDLGKKAVKLKVSAPFHSEFMLPAARTMKDALSQVELLNPSLPIITNILASSVSDPELLKECLVLQVAGKVRWRETMDFMASQGVIDVIEVGPGKVLSNLAKRSPHAFGFINVGSCIEVSEFIQKYR
ncbi:MAG: ACP S-malonyltransferase [Pseudomonadota bacterium]